MAASEFNQVPEHLIHGAVVGTVKDEYFYKATDKQYFPIGAIYRKGDRAWRYARGHVNSGGLFPSTIYACCSLEDQAINQRYVAENQAVGDKEVVVTITAGDANSGVFAKDMLYGGYITVRKSATHNQTRMIIGNEAQDGAGDMKIFVDVPWETALTDSNSMYCSAIFSPYHAVVNAEGQDGDSWRPAVGLPVAPATDGQWLWLQTWGPCHITVELGFYGTHNIQAVFAYNGTILDHDWSEAYQIKAQHAGFMMNQINGGSQSYEPFTFLQITP